MTYPNILILCNLEYKTKMFDFNRTIKTLTIISISMNNRIQDCTLIIRQSCVNSFKLSLKLIHSNFVFFRV